MCDSRVATPTLDGWVATFLTQRGHDVSERTNELYTQTADRLKSPFGEETKLDKFTVAGTAEWWAAMSESGQTEAPCRMHSGQATPS